MFYKNRVLLSRKNIFNSSQFNVVESASHQENYKSCVFGLVESMSVWFGVDFNVSGRAVLLMESPIKILSVLHITVDLLQLALVGGIPVSLNIVDMSVELSNEFGIQAGLEILLGITDGIIRLRVIIVRLVIGIVVGI